MNQGERHAFERLQKGAALYRTDPGDFAALFLPQSDSWTALEIIQTEKDSLYICSFRGRPRPWPTNRMEGPRRTYFVKHANELCLTSNEQLSEKLHHILNLK